MIYWREEWKKILREVIVKDAELRRLMCVPPNVKIMEFIDDYFCHMAATGPLLTNQVCRVVYHETTDQLTSNPHVLEQEMVFDIYVKKTEQHTANVDRLDNRTELISERIQWLLIHDKDLGDTYKFNTIFDADMFSSTYEYSRRRLILRFKKVTM